MNQILGNLSSSVIPNSAQLSPYEVPQAGTAAKSPVPFPRPLSLHSENLQSPPSSITGTVTYLIENALRPLLELLNMVIASFMNGSTQPSTPAVTNGAPTSGGPNQTDAPASSAPSSSPNTVSESSPSTPREVKTLLYKPFSEKDKKAVILLPTALTDEAYKVEILSPNGKKVIAHSIYSGELEGRGVYRFPISGEEIPKGSIIRVRLEGGEERRLTIEKPTSRLEARPYVDNKKL